MRNNFSPNIVLFMRKCVKIVRDKEATDNKKIRHGRDASFMLRN